MDKFRITVRAEFADLLYDKSVWMTSDDIQEFADNAESVGHFDIEFTGSKASALDIIESVFELQILLAHTKFITLFGRDEENIKKCLRMRKDFHTAHILITAHIKGEA